MGNDDDEVVEESYPGGPSDLELLPHFRNHVAYDIWKGKDRGIIESVTGYGRAVMWKLPHQTPFEEAWVQMCRHLSISYLPYRTFKHGDKPLLTAFVERWHPETNSFHMPWGEMTITLLDVFMILGLDIDKKGVGCLFENKHNLIQKVARIYDLSYPQVMECKKHGGIRLSFLRDHRGNDPKSFLLHAMFTTIFKDKTIDRVKIEYMPLLENVEKVGDYAWGTATLAFLYHELGKACKSSCKRLAGCTTLLEAWIYEYFPHFRPNGALNNNYCEGNIPTILRWNLEKPALPSSHHRLMSIRNELDNLRLEQVEWMPYKADVVKYYPVALFHGYIQCVTTIEPYMPDRVSRQFGFIQGIPYNPLQRSNCTSLWDARIDHLLYKKMSLKYCVDAWDAENTYFMWYVPRTHPIINPENEKILSRSSTHTGHERVSLALSYLRPIYNRDQQPLAEYQILELCDKAYKILGGDYSRREASASRGLRE